MNKDLDNITNDDSPERHDALENVDLLISRAVDGHTSRAEWVLLELAAAEDASVWRRLALAHRDQSLLARGVGEVVAGAELVDLPSPLEAERWASRSEHLSESRPGMGSLRAWGGWAAAAILTFAVVVQTNRLGTAQTQVSDSLKTPVNSQSAGMLSTASDAWNAYLNRGKQEGRVLGEVPDAVLVDSQPVADGEGYEVVYVRQVLERAHVADLYRFSHDAAGTPRPVRVRVMVPQAQSPSPHGQSTY